MATQPEMAVLEARAGEVAAMLKALANPKRLLILCKLVEHGRLSAGQIGDAVGLSQSAASQHLAVMRDEQLIGFEREGQTLHYRIADERLKALLDSLYQIYCNPKEVEA